MKKIRLKEVMQLSQSYPKSYDKVGIQLRFLASQVSGLMHDPNSFPQTQQCQTSLDNV